MGVLKYIHCSQPATLSVHSALSYLFYNFIMYLSRNKLTILKWNDIGMIFSITESNLLKCYNIKKHPLDRYVSSKRCDVVSFMHIMGNDLLKQSHASLLQRALFYHPNCVILPR